MSTPSFKVTGTPGEPADDNIRPIGDLPEGTEFKYEDGSPENGRVFVGKLNRCGYIDVLNDDGSVRHDIKPSARVRVIAYPEPKQTYLERLPETVQTWILNRAWCPPPQQVEALARVIYENRDAIFAAGEPVERLAIPEDETARNVNEGDSEGMVWLGFVGAREVTADEAIPLFRRGMAIALAAKGGAQ